METYGKEDVGRKLLDLKEQLEKKKEKRQELQGELKSFMKQLKELGIDSVEQAEMQMDKNEKMLNEMEKDINNKINELEELL